jgi:hypothetical protein
MVFDALDRRAEFEQSMADLRQAYDAGDAGLGFWIAHTYAFIGDTDAMFDWLERTQAQGALTLRPATTFFAPWHADRRWQQLMADLGQTQAELDAIQFELPPFN